MWGRFYSFFCEKNVTTAPQNIFENMPLEILLKILAKLDMKTMAKFSQVNKTIYFLIKDDIKHPCYDPRVIAKFHSLNASIQRIQPSLFLHMLSISAGTSSVILVLTGALLIGHIQHSPQSFFIDDDWLFKLGVALVFGGGALSVIYNNDKWCVDTRNKLMKINETYSEINQILLNGELHENEPKQTRFIK